MKILQLFVLCFIASCNDFPEWGRSQPPQLESKEERLIRRLTKTLASLGGKNAKIVIIVNKDDITMRVKE